MPLKTRQNPDTGNLEVLVDNEWLKFEEYRSQRIDDAYRNSIRFLRERLGDDSAQEIKHKSDDLDSTN